MAKEGKRFSDRENTQKGSTNSRAVTKEGLTNKNDYHPSAKADYMADRRSDIERMRGVAKETTGAAKAAQEAAALRGASRFAIGAIAEPAAALTTGYGIGRAIGEAGGDELVRKGIEKSGLGKSIDKVATGDRVELSESAKERIAKGELKSKGTDERVNKEDYPTYQKDTKSAESFRDSFKDAKDQGKQDFKFEGRTYNTEEKKYAKGGLVKNQGIGASMKPHNVFISKGKK